MGCVCGCLLITGKLNISLNFLLIPLALVGKEERNKDFSQNLVEGHHSSIGPAEVKENEAEQGLPVTEHTV